MKLYHGTTQDCFSQIIKSGYLCGIREEIFRGKNELVNSWTLSKEAAFCHGQFIFVIEIDALTLFEYFDYVYSDEQEYITDLTIPLFELPNEDNGFPIKIKNILMPNINYNNTYLLKKYGYY